MIETVGWVARGLYSTTTLLAAGFALLCCFTVAEDKDTLKTLRRICARLAILGLVIPCVWVASLAAELGGEWSASLDPYYYQMIGSSPAADLLLWRSLALVALLVWSNTPLQPWLGAVSAVLAAFSFTQYGHSLSDPALVRSILLTLHLSVIAWWFAVVPTLLWIYKYHPSNAIPTGERFGAQAKYSVVLAILCGAALSALQLDSMQWKLQNTYTLALLIKLAIVAAILCIAAFNYTRAFRSNHSSAAPTTNKIILLLRFDFFLFVAVFLASAWLTGPAANY